MMKMDPEMRKEIIMEHYMHPINRGVVDDKRYIKVNTNSETCIDNIDLYILFENNKIVDLHFEGEACAISTSATSIMINLLIGKTIEEVKELARNYQNMIEEKEYDAELLGEANCYDEIYKQQNRKNCAIIPWKGILKAIGEYEKRQK